MHPSFISSGYTALDKKIGGFRKGELVLLAGRPGMGKTALMLNIAKQLQHTTSVLFLSHENSKNSIEKLFGSSISNLEDTLDITPDSIKEKVNKTRAEMVLIDYVQLLNWGRGNQLQILKELAIELDVCIVINAQLPRDCECREDKRPISSDLNNGYFNSENTKLIDTSIYLYRDDYYQVNPKIEKENIQTLELICLTQDPNTSGTVFLKMDFRRNEILE